MSLVLIYLLLPVRRGAPVINSQLFMFDAIVEAFDCSVLKYHGEVMANERTADPALRLCSAHEVDAEAVVWSQVRQ